MKIKGDIARKKFAVGIVYGKGYAVWRKAPDMYRFNPLSPYFVRKQQALMWIDSFIRENRLEKISNPMFKAIKSGNSKLHKSCGIFNISCHRNCSYCYMKKLKRIYPNIEKSWESNKELTQRADFIPNTIAVIKKRKYSHFRIHAMGEFYTPSYLMSWYAIAAECEDTTFYAYTKEHDLVRYVKNMGMIRPDNFTLVKSIIEIDDISDIFMPDVKRQGFDSFALVASTINGETAYKKRVVCQASKHKGNDYCMNKCKRCAKKGQTIILPLH